MPAIPGWFSEAQDLGFPREPRQPFRVARDGHLAPQLGVLGPIDLSHPALAQLGGDLEVGERLADQGEGILLLVATVQAVQG